MKKFINISFNFKDFLIILSFMILAITNELYWCKKINNSDNYFFIIIIAVIFGFLLGLAYAANINIVIRKLFKTNADLVCRKIYLINLPLYLLCLYPFKIHLLGNISLNKILIILILILMLIMIVMIFINIKCGFYKYKKGNTNIEESSTENMIITKKEYFIKNTEKIVVIIIATLIVFIISFVKITVEYGAGDAAVYYQLIESVSETGKPVSDLGDKILDFLHSGLLTIKADNYVSIPLGEINKPASNMLKTHSIFIIYLLAPFVKIIPVKVLLTLLTAISFTLLILLLYLSLRKKNVPFFGSILLCLLVSTHPAWSQSIAGQLYIERFFIGLGFLYLFLLVDDNINWIALLVTGILCLLISERTGVMIGSFTIGYTLLYWKKFNYKIRIYLFLLGTVLIGYSGILVKFYIENPYYNSSYLPTSIEDLISRFQSQRFVGGLIVFSLFNLIILGIFGLFEWEMFILAFITMLPNIIGNVGGGEKTGFLTHYHTLYFPFIVLAAGFGYSNLANKIKPYIRKAVLYPSTLALAILTAGIYPNIFDNIRFSTQQIKDYAIIKYFTIFPLCIDNGPIVQQNKILEIIQKKVKENSIVTTTEYMMPILYKNRTVYYYPMGLDIADYAVLSFEMDSNSKIIYTGASNYLGELKKINSILTKRMRQTGYDMNNVEIIGNIVIIKRLKKISPLTSNK